MNEELQKLREEFEQKIKALEDKYEPKEEWPKEGDFYWGISYRGKIELHVWENDDINKKMFEIGNFFKSGAEAEFMVEKLKVIKELKQLARPFIVESINYLINFDHTHMDFIILGSYGQQPPYGDFCFNTKEEAEQAINIIGEDRIKKYLFGAKEGDNNDYGIF